MILVAAVVTAIAWPARWRAIRSSVHDYRWWLVLAAVGPRLALRRALAVSTRSCSAAWGRTVAGEHPRSRRCPLLRAGRAARPAAKPAEQDSQAVGRQSGGAPSDSRPQGRLADENKRLSVGEQFLDWWTGARARLLTSTSTRPRSHWPGYSPTTRSRPASPVLARLETMDASDPRRRAAEAQLAPDVPRAQRRAAFQTAVRMGLELKDQQHARLRSFRNIILITTAGLTALVIAVCLVGAWRPDALPLCFGPPPPTPAPVQGPAGVACPSEEAPPTPGTVPRRLPAPGDVTLVALLGMLGGGLSGALAIRSLQGSSTPYDVPVALSLLKLPSGALSALVGLLFVRGGFVPGLSQLDSQPQILAYAFLFGIAQQLVTRLVDQQAQEILPASIQQAEEPVQRRSPPAAAGPRADAAAHQPSESDPGSSGCSAAGGPDVTPCGRSIGLVGLGVKMMRPAHKGSSGSRGG